MPRRAFSVTIKDHPDSPVSPVTVFADTAGKAKYEAFLDIRDVFPDLRLTDLRARSLGVIDTPTECLKCPSKNKLNTYFC